MEEELADSCNPKVRQHGSRKLSLVNRFPFAVNFSATRGTQRVFHLLINVPAIRYIIRHHRDREEFLWEGRKFAHRAWEYIRTNKMMRVNRGLGE